MMLGIVVNKEGILLLPCETGKDKLELLDYKEFKATDNLENIFKGLKKENINKACIVLSDYFVYHSIYNFENIEKDDIDKLIKFKSKDLVPFSPDDMNVGHQIIEKKIESGKTRYNIVSAITDKSLVAKYEKILESLGISDFTVTSLTYPLLNFCEGTNFALVNSNGENTTMIFSANRKISYIRKFVANGNPNNDINETVNFYLRKFPGTKIETIYSFNDLADTLPDFKKQVKIIDISGHVKINKSIKLNNGSSELMAAAGVLLCM